MVNNYFKSSGDTDNKKTSIVISGMSGRLPECDNIEEFKQALYDGIDLVTADDRRWPIDTYSLPQRFGKVKDLSRFDAAFFSVHAKLADRMDPQMRMLLEASYEAIVDAGINPKDLRGSNTGVFMGTSNTEALDMWNRDVDEVSGHSALGTAGLMLANRISYSFDLHGPSFVLDTGCSSTLVALNEAVMAIESGQCDAALVGGANVLMNPIHSYGFDCLGLLSKEGKCKSFDANGSGFVRAEAAVVILIQKEDVAKRVYATILGIGTNNDGYKEEGITFPNGKTQNELIRQVYAKNGVNPLDVCFVEAHATGTKVGDPQEMNSVADFFCKDRKKPLLIGGVKSNMGHGEAAAGLCAIAKVLLTLETGIIPANLHFETPNPAIPELQNGLLKVVDKNLKLPGNIVAVNSFGFGGQNVHVILKANTKLKTKEITENIPRIVATSGRTKEAVQTVLDKSYKNCSDTEFLGLIDQISTSNIKGHGFRGFSILNNNSTPTVEIVSENYEKKRPLWYVYSGMGSQWAKMAKDLMELDPFRQSIEKSSKALKPHGFNLEQLLLNSTDNTFNNLLNSFVTITAMQVALTDVLKAVGLEPDGLIGHSMGELGCAYADGTITTEQAVLASLARGQAVFETKLPVGAMAIVNMGWKQLEPKCPPEIVLACHNSPNNVTVSGPQKAIIKLIRQLTNDDIFAKQVDCGDFGFHSKYIADAGPLLRKSLDKLIPNPKLRSKRWISSSVPESDWNSSLAELSSAAYFVNNFLSPVLFHETLQHVPQNAIVIEVAPTGIMQAILRRSLNSQVTNINMMNKESDNNLRFLLESLGKIYNAGAQPQFGNLYPPVNFPVGKGTPMIGSLVQWDHSTEWCVPRFEDINSQKEELVIKVDVSKEENQYLQGHTIDGRLLFPGAGYFYLVWQGFAKLQNRNFEELSVVFEDVQFPSATILPKEGTITFLLNILQGNGEFELSEGGSIVCTGKIRSPQNVEEEIITVAEPNINQSKNHIEIAVEDLYNELRLCGYQFSGEFCSLIEAHMYSDIKYNKGKLKWNNNWVTFIDGVFQFQTIEYKGRKLVLPVRIESLLINPQKQLEYINQLNKIKELDIHFYPNFELVKSGGIQLNTVKTMLAPKKPVEHAPPRITRCEFVPDKNLVPLSKDPKKSKSDALCILLQIVGENCVFSEGFVKIIEINVNSSCEEDILMPEMVKIMESALPVTVDGTVVISESIDTSVFDNSNINWITVNGSDKTRFDEDHNLMVMENVLFNKNLMIFEDANVLLKENGFVLLEENIDSVNPSELVVPGWEIVAYQVSTEKVYILLRRPVKINLNETTFQITNANFDWVEPLAGTIKTFKMERKNLYLFSQGEKNSGLMGLARSLLCEPGNQGLRCISIEDQNAPKFSLKTYEEQLRKDFIYNVFKDNQWGCYRHIVLDTTTFTEDVKVEHACVNSLNRGELSSLKWIETPLKYYKSEDYQMGHIYYSSLNFKDVLYATGKINPNIISTEQVNSDFLLGIEFSGRDSKGCRIMGMVTSKSLATTVLLDDSAMTWPVPEKWSLEEAATIPVVYSTSYYALIERGKLEPGETILIHAGSGGVGLSAISIALHMGCKVFTTVSSQSKCDFLKKTFPQLTDDCIGNSRNTSFKELIMQQTANRGVDVIINSLAGHLLKASLKCLAPNGRFLEIGKVDIVNNSALGMELFMKNVTFHGIATEVIAEDKAAKQRLWNYVNEGIANGAVRPLPTTVFNENELESAFRYMAAGKHVGKVVIKVRDEESRTVQLPQPKTISAVPSTYVDSKKSYLLVGGLGGVGFETIFWLISRGATKILVASRGGVKSNYQTLWLRRWNEMGINVIVTTTDCSSYKGAERLIQEANNLAPLGGILNVAMVLRDALIENQTKTNFEEVAKPKIQATQNLDQVSRVMAPQLDFFVLFSTTLASFGNAGQSNYSMVNHIMDRICVDRHKDGYPSVSIQWGTVADVGTFVKVVKENYNILKGMYPQKLSSLFSTLEMFMRQPYPVVSSVVLDERKRKEGDKSEQNGVVGAVASVLGIKDITTVSFTTYLTNLGVDSLMSAEIRQMLDYKYNIKLTQQEIGALTFEDIKKMDTDSDSKSQTIVD